MLHYESVQSWCSVAPLYAKRDFFGLSNCEVERQEKSRRLFETDLGIYERQHRLPVTLGAGRDLRLSLWGKEGRMPGTVLGI